MKKEVLLFALMSSLMLNGCDSDSRKVIDSNEVNSENEYVSFIINLMKKT